MKYRHFRVKRNMYIKGLKTFITKKVFTKDTLVNGLLLLIVLLIIVSASELV